MIDFENWKKIRQSYQLAAPHYCHKYHLIFCTRMMEKSVKKLFFLSKKNNETSYLLKILPQLLNIFSPFLSNIKVLIANSSFMFKNCSLMRLIKLIIKKEIFKSMYIWRKAYSCHKGKKVACQTEHWEFAILYYKTSDHTNLITIIINNFFV